jgi:hypothetical protein
MNRLEILLARLKNNQIVDPDLKFALSIILKDRLHVIENNERIDGLSNKTNNSESIRPKTKGLRQGLQSGSARSSGETESSLREGE